MIPRCTKVQQKQFELEKARKEIEVARAKGAAKARRIIPETLSDSYLRYLLIRTLNKQPERDLSGYGSKLADLQPVSGR